MLTPTSRADAPVPLRILPLGDSITYGAGPAPSHIIPGGYRSRLYTELTAKSFAITYVGEVAVDKLKRQVFFVDQYANFVNNGVLDPTHIPDGAHPDQVGYDRMADTWAKAITAAIPGTRP